MNCPICSQPLSIELKMIGGCCGHFGEDDRCYCDSPDIRFEYYCHTYTEYGKKITNRKYCMGHNKLKTCVVPGLTDKDAVERFIKEKMKEENKNE
jgi:hypothetical protein